jgi:hypothetical protein
LLDWTDVSTRSLPFLKQHKKLPSWEAALLMALALLLDRPDVRLHHKKAMSSERRQHQTRAPRPRVAMVRQQHQTKELHTIVEGLEVYSTAFSVASLVDRRNVTPRLR